MYDVVTCVIEGRVNPHSSQPLEAVEGRDVNARELWMCVRYAHLTIAVQRKALLHKSCPRDLFIVDALHALSLERGLGDSEDVVRGLHPYQHPRLMGVMALSSPFTLPHPSPSAPPHAPPQASPHASPYTPRTTACSYSRWGARWLTTRAAESS